METGTTKEGGNSVIPEQTNLHRFKTVQHCIFNNRYSLAIRVSHSAIIPEKLECMDESTVYRGEEGFLFLLGQSANWAKLLGGRNCNSLP